MLMKIWSQCDIGIQGKIILYKILMFVVSFNVCFYKSFYFWIRGVSTLCVTLSRVLIRYSIDMFTWACILILYLPFRPSSVYQSCFLTRIIFLMGFPCILMKLHYEKLCTGHFSRNPLTHLSKHKTMTHSVTIIIVMVQNHVWFN